MTTIILASPTPGETLATTVMRAGSTAAASFVLISPTAEVRLPDDGLSEAWSALPTVRCIVPRVLTPSGALLEAGAEAEAGGLRPRGWGSSVRSGEYRSRRYVDGTTYSWLAVRRSDLLRIALDPLADDPATIVSAVLEAIPAAADSILYEPSWVVEAPPAFASPSMCRLAGRTARPTALSGNRILIMVGGLPRDVLNGADMFTDQFITSLAETCRVDEMTVLATSDFGAVRRLSYYRSIGLGVHVGPLDLGRWFAERWGRFSHVVLAGTSLQSAARSWIEETQPQAARILAFDALPFRDVETLRAITSPDEIPGLEWVRTSVEARVARLSRWADSVWCERLDDVEFLGNFLLDKTVVHLPHRRQADRSSRPLPERHGLLIFATDGDDVVQANEDATLRVLRSVVPWLRLRLPSLQVTVITGAPSPLLAQVIADFDVFTVPPSLSDSESQTARLVLVAHEFGTGGRSIIHRCMAARVPFVTTPHAAQGVVLGQVAPRAVFADLWDLRQRSLALLSDDDQWTAYARALSETVDADELAYLSKMRMGAARLGITPALDPPRLPSYVPDLGFERNPIPVETRPIPSVLAARPAQPDDDSADEALRYARWRSRFGPTEPVLQALRADLTSLPYRPRISIIMPVYNTDPLVLRAAIASVEAQIYENWQLCVADDGSTSGATRQVLDSLVDDPRVSLTRLPGQSGISGASNAALALADGDYVTFLDHDDVLKPHALAQVVRWLNADPELDLLYSDEDKIDEAGRLIQPHLKPDWAPNQLMSQNYICHLLVVRKTLVDRVGGLRSLCDGSQDWDLVLRVTELTKRIAHIPEPLYSWRIVPGSAAAAADAKPYALTAAKIALADALDRRDQDGTVEDSAVPGIFHTRYEVKGQPRVAIVIPTRNGAHLLKRCVTSILEKSTYSNYELVIIDNQSDDPETLGYLAELPATILRYPHLFNYARMMNFAARSVECDALLFLNNDTEVRSPGWIEALLEHAMRPEVGAVGGRLYFGDGRLQHEGIIVGVFGGWAANVDHGGYFRRGDMIRDTSAVTGACTMMRPDVYWRIGGNDERLRVAYNDVDLCLRVHQAGYQVVFTPYAELFHYESSTRSGYEHHEDGPLFGIRWRPKDLVDPYYNPIFMRGSPFRIVN